MKALKHSLIVAMSVIGLSIAGPALAQQANTTTHNPPPPPPPACGGNACVTQWTVGGGALFGGAGASVFNGEGGFNEIEKRGSGGVEIKLNADGGLCGVDCADGGFTFQGLAREEVMVSTGAWGETSGTMVTAENLGQAQAVVNFSLSRNFTAPQVSNNPQQP